MKIILIMFLYIASAQCGLLQMWAKHDLEKRGSVSHAEHRQHQVQELYRVMDFYENGNITLVTELLIEGLTFFVIRYIDNIETDTGLPPGLHKWEIRFLSSQKSAEEINRILSIVETAANKTGQLLGKTCTTGDIAVTCNFNINIDVTNESKSKIDKREVKIQNNGPTGLEEIESILSLVEAGNKNGEADGKNCTTVDGALICKVYLPADSSHQSTLKIYKREIEYQNSAQLIDEDEVKVNPDTVNVPANTTVERNTNCTTVECLFDNTASFVGDVCPPGKGRADDGTCVEEVM